MGVDLGIRKDRGAFQQFAGEVLLSAVDTAAHLVSPGAEAIEPRNHLKLAHPEVLRRDLRAPSVGSGLIGHRDLDPVPVRRAVAHNHTKGLMSVAKHRRTDIGGVAKRQLGGKDPFADARLEVVDGDARRLVRGW